MLGVYVQGAGAPVLGNSRILFWVQGAPNLASWREWSSRGRRSLGLLRATQCAQDTQVSFNSLPHQDTS